MLDNWLYRIKSKGKIIIRARSFNGKTYFQRKRWYSVSNRRSRLSWLKFQTEFEKWVIVGRIWKILSINSIGKLKQSKGWKFSGISLPNCNLFPILWSRRQVIPLKYLAKLNKKNLFHPIIPYLNKFKDQKYDPKYVYF